MAPGVNILLVDDDEVDVMGIRRAFRANDIDAPIHVARHGLEALARLRGEAAPIVPRPYMILLDMNMPRMDGLEFLRELRADPDHKQAIVFVLTTSASPVDRSAAYEQNVAGFIVKENAGDDWLRVVHLLRAYWEIIEMP